MNGYNVDWNVLDEAIKLNDHHLRKLSFIDHRQRSLVKHTHSPFRRAILRSTGCSQNEWMWDERAGAICRVHAPPSHDARRPRTAAPPCEIRIWIIFHMRDATSDKPTPIHIFLVKNVPFFPLISRRQIFMILAVMFIWFMSLMHG